MRQTTDMSATLADVGKLQAYAVLLGTATLCVYAGAHYALRLPRATRRARRAHLAAGHAPDWPAAADGDDDDDDDDARRDDDKVTAADAWLFPILGSAVLFTMYLAFKYLDPAALNALLSAYFGLVGAAAVFQCFRTVAKAVVPGLEHRAASKPQDKQPKKAPKDAAAAADDDDDDDDKELTTREVLEHWAANASRFIRSLSVLDWGLLLPLSVGVVGTYVRTRHWAASNVVAAALAWQAVALVELDRFVTGSIVLGGLFLYDIFWVFGTNVMVSVARNFDAPIKITWPRNLPLVLYAYATDAPLPPKWELAMLGLGDIVIPGCFVALALRFDQHRYVSSLSAEQTRRFTSRSAFPSPYFSATLAAYFAGLVVTMAVMTIFNAAQPALLYLSPACVGALAVTAAARGEWAVVWAWADIDEEAEKKKKEKQEKKEQKEKEKKEQEKEKKEKEQKEQKEKEKKEQEEVST